MNEITVSGSLAQLKYGGILRAASAAGSPAFAEIIRGQGRAAMSLEDYKAFIMQQIQSMKVDASQKSSVFTIGITDEGYRAMQQDEEYENWVLNTIRSELSYRDPFGKSHFRVLSFGADRAQYRAEGMTGDDPAEKLMNDDETFWERRTRKAHEYVEFCEKKARLEYSVKQIELRKLRAEAARTGKDAPQDVPTAGVSAEMLLDLLMPEE